MMTRPPCSVPKMEIEAGDRTMSFPKAGGSPSHTVAKILRKWACEKMAIFPWSEWI